MAAPQQPRPEVGDILVVIHDFVARSSDELTLSKGDRVELLERDDEFGDGWFLGKHMVTGNTGLFPEVYTRPAPKGFPTGAGALAAVKQIPSSYASLDKQQSSTSPGMFGHSMAPPHASSDPAPASLTSGTSVVTPPATAMGNPATAAVSTEMPASPTTPTAIIAPIPTQSPVSIPFVPSASSPPGISQTSPPVSASSGYSSRLTSSGHDSAVLHETLNVIDEHITDLRSPPGTNGTNFHAPTDSGSEYSSNLDHRMSYIQGEETDEEEDGLHTRAEVEAWGPDDVAEYLFTAGVEKRHCEVFRDQEISGEVILGMDQASLFITAFDLGPVGRRLKTWQKIKALQDEVNGLGSAMASKRRSTYGSDVGSEDARRSNRSRTNTITGSSNPPVLQQRLPPIDDRPISVHSRRLSLNQTPRMDPTQPISPVSPMSPRGFLDNIPVSPVSPRRSVIHEKRPSAASVRDLHHSRRHSSTDYRASISSSIVPRLATSGTFPLSDAQQASALEDPQQHKKHPSFDRNWTLGGAATHISLQQQQQQKQQQPPPTQHQPLYPRPLSSTGMNDILAASGLDHSLSPGLNEQAADLDRGYFSGNDADTRQRSFLQKKNRDSLMKSGRSGSTASTYAEEQRMRSATALSRHSRFGSVDSVREPSLAAQKYYGMASNGSSAPHRRTTSTNTTDSVRMRPALPPKDGPAPSVTRLDAANGSNTVDKTRPSPVSPVPPSPQRHGIHGDWFSSKPGFKTPGFGLRALSDAVVGHDRGKMSSPASHADSFPKDSPIQSPSRTGSSTPSAGPSFELDSPDPRSPSTAATTTSGRSNAARKKGKKETSAYQRGLQKISPREAIIDADYSGWMKKKSSNLMATWKPRLFVLKGRRLAYYYSEDDDQEKGLIDISFHRVLPADNERLTGLHATLTGASTTAIPAKSNMPTLALTEAEAEPSSTLKSGGQDSIFIFKLVPPRAGLSRAVNFTKPMVHYFAVPNVKQGRLWMAALMKATIDRDDMVAVATTYQQKTISLAKARQMRHRPPALMNLDEKMATVQLQGQADDDDYDDANVLGDEEKRMLAAAMATTGARKAEKPLNGLGISYDKDGAAVPSMAAPMEQPLATFQGNDKLRVASQSARARQFVFEPENDDDRLPMSA